MSQDIIIQRSSPISRASAQVLWRGGRGPTLTLAISDLKEEESAPIKCADDTKTERRIRNENGKSAMQEAGNRHCKEGSVLWGMALPCSLAGKVQQNSAWKLVVSTFRWGMTFLKGEVIQCESNLERI